MSRISMCYMWFEISNAEKMKRESGENPELTRSGEQERKSPFSTGNAREAVISRKNEVMPDSPKTCHIVPLSYVFPWDNLKSLITSRTGESHVYYLVLQLSKPRCTRAAAFHLSLYCDYEA